ncbi:MAG: glycosyltransferase [Candidatus Aureabacteria bacterium]|nr:glycosyltransferase [Candidatus Auribacterota bacterium]
MDTLLTLAYSFLGFLLLIYSLNCFVMVYLFLRRKKEADQTDESMVQDLFLHQTPPHVTTQIPVFNECNVIERCIHAVCRMKYLKGLHEIQILDDSTDETSELINRLVDSYRALGVDIKVIRREARTGFKAGALNNGLQQAKGDLLALFDADFIPPDDFLLKTVPNFLKNDRLGFVQARWSHLNSNVSLLTRAQEIGIDGHFMVEQAARAWNGLYMNFNGTAGVWRKKTILSSGGWQWDTLTEDMDLSYRIQIEGWKPLFIYDLAVPAELPEDVHAFKSQQFRWAKGSIQTAKKLLPIILKGKDSWFKKFQAIMHLSHYIVYPLMLMLALLSYPVLMTNHFHESPVYYPLNTLILLLALIAPNSVYLTSQLIINGCRFSKLLMLSSVVLIGVGAVVSNSIGVFEALIGRNSDFIRTPKKGEVIKKKYSVKRIYVAWYELVLGLYCLFVFISYIQAGRFWMGPFLFIYSVGFLYFGIVSLTSSGKDPFVLRDVFKKLLKRNSLGGDSVTETETELFSSMA